MLLPYVVQLALDMGAVSLYIICMTLGKRRETNLQYSDRENWSGWTDWPIEHRPGRDPTHNWDASYYTATPGMKNRYINKKRPATRSKYNAPKVLRAMEEHMALVSKPRSGPKDRCIWIHASIAAPLEKIAPELSHAKRLDAIVRHFLRKGLHEQVAILRSEADNYVAPDSNHRRTVKR